MSKYSIVLIAILLLSNFWSHSTLQAQDSASLSFIQPVIGSLNNTQPEQRWSFEATTGQIISLRMQSTSGNLEPTLELLNARGDVLANSQYASLGSVAIEAVTMTETAAYTVRVTRSSDSATAGDYRLWLLPGYSFLLIDDPIDASTPLRSWREPNASSRPTQGKLRIALEANNNLTWTTADALGSYQDVYLQTDVELENYNAYWEYGLLFRGQRDVNTGAAEFYLLSINSSSQWRMTASMLTGLKIIQDWADLPAAAQLHPLNNTLAVMAQDDDFTLFLNGITVGTVTDNTLPEAGLVGLGIGTSTRPNNIVAALFDNYLVTVPAALSDQAINAPQNLEMWNGTVNDILTELTQVRVIPAGGKPGFLLPSAYVSNSTASSIIFVSLMNGTAYTDFIYAADVRWDSDSENIACALEFRVQDGDNFSIVYFDRQGGYGGRQVVSNADPIWQEYALAESIIRDNLATNRILVIALGNRLLFYINGQLAADAFVQQVSGSVFLAAYNYELASTYCGFTNVWLRNLS